MLRRIRKETNLDFPLRITQLSEETDVMFIKPLELTPRLEDIREAAKDIREKDILEAANIPRERAKYRRRLTRAQLFGRPPSPLAGVGVQASEDHGPTWKVTPTSLPGSLAASRRKSLKAEFQITCR